MQPIYAVLSSSGSTRWFQTDWFRGRMQLGVSVVSGSSTPNWSLDASCQVGAGLARFHADASDPIAATLPISRQGLLHTPNHFRRRYGQCISQFQNRCQRWAESGTFEKAYIFRMVPAFEAQLLLCQTSAFAEFNQDGCERTLFWCVRDILVRESCHRQRSYCTCSAYCSTKYTIHMLRVSSWRLRTDVAKRKV